MTPAPDKPPNALVVFDEHLQQLLDQLCRGSRGETRIDASRSGKGVLQGFVLPAVTLSVPEGDVVQNGEVRPEAVAFVRALTGRFSKVRKHIFELVFDAWRRGRNRQIVILTERRAYSPKIRIRSEASAEFDDG
jgi:hypothetical protein